jgi:hypothetical protein
MAGVEKDRSFIKKCMVMSLMVIYLLIAVTYLLYLPKYSSLRPSTTYTQLKTQLALNPTHHMEHRTANMVVLLHQVYKSTVDNKREVLNMVSKAILLISFVLGSIVLIGRLKFLDREQFKVRYTYQYAYLCYRSLRI